MSQAISGTISKLGSEYVMKHVLIVSILAMVAATGSASAGPVTSDDLLKAQDNGK
jgi:hypothetical protein